MQRERLKKTHDTVLQVKLAEKNERGQEKKAMMLLNFKIESCEASVGLEMSATTIMPNLREGTSLHRLCSAITSQNPRMSHKAENITATALAAPVRLPVLSISLTPMLSRPKLVTPSTCAR